MPKIERGLFGDQPVNKIARYKISLPIAVVEKIFESAARTESDEVKHRSGGFQTWIRETASRIQDNTLEADDCYIGKTYRYSLSYGEGGWENVFRAILQGMVGIELLK